MGVLRERQREMAQRVGGVARLLERTQHQERDDALFGLAGNFFRQALVVLRANGDVHRGNGDGHRFVAPAAGAPVPPLRPAVSMLYGHAALGKILDAQRVAEGVRHLLELQNLFRIGFFMDAVQRADAAPFQVTRDGLIGRQHELLDQPVRDVALAANHADHLSAVVELDHRLWQVEVDRSQTRAAGVQDHRQIAHGAEIFGEMRILRGRGSVILQARHSPPCTSCARRSGLRRAQIPTRRFRRSRPAP